jgi:hypothetical protein
VANRSSSRRTACSNSISRHRPTRLETRSPMASDRCRCAQLHGGGLAVPSDRLFHGRSPIRSCSMVS